MNPLTNMKNIIKLSENELKSNSKSSWHDMYKGSAWIFVGGFPYDLTEGDIISVFSQYGEIVNINLVRDKTTGKSKGFCFVCFQDQRSTILSVDNLNGIKILNRSLRVDHVANYKMPKNDDKIDEETRKIRLEGCAPIAQLAPEQIKNEIRTGFVDDVNDMNSKLKIEKHSKVKKDKKAKKSKKEKKSKKSKKEKKIKKKKEKKSTTSSSSSDTDSDSSYSHSSSKNNNQVNTCNIESNTENAINLNKNYDDNRTSQSRKQPTQHHQNRNHYDSLENRQNINDKSNYERQFRRPTDKNIPNYRSRSPNREYNNDDRHHHDRRRRNRSRS